MSSSRCRCPWAGTAGAGRSCSRCCRVAKGSVGHRSRPGCRSVCANDRCRHHRLSRWRGRKSSSKVDRSFAGKTAAGSFGSNSPVRSMQTSDNYQVEAVLSASKQRERLLNGLKADAAAHTSSVARLATKGSLVQPFDTMPVWRSLSGRAVKRFNRTVSFASRAMILGVDFIGSMTSNLDEHQCVGECRDRLRAADFTTALRASFVAS